MGPHLFIVSLLDIGEEEFFKILPYKLKLRRINRYLVIIHRSLLSRLKKLSWDNLLLVPTVLVRTLLFCSLVKILGLIQWGGVSRTPRPRLMRPIESIITPVRLRGRLAPLQALAYDVLFWVIRRSVIGNTMT